MDWLVAFPGAAMLEKKTMELLPSPKKDTSLVMVAAGLATLSHSPLAKFVSSSSRGSFDAACQIVNNLERDIPVRQETHTGFQQKS